MEYGKLIRDAWTTTWRYRFLWILGLLAGGTVGLPGLNGSARMPSGSRSGGGPGPDQIQQVSPALASSAQALAAWAAANVGLLIGLAAVGVLVVLALIVISFIAQGGMATATTDLATGRETSFGRAWSAGLHLFWRFVGMWLVLAGAVLVIGAAVASVIGIGVITATAAQAPIVGGLIASFVAVAVIVGFVAFVNFLTPNTTLPRWLVLVAAALFALPIFTVFIVAALTLSIVVAFAQRAIAVEDVGPIAALESGWRLMRAHMSESLITWLVNVGLAMVCGIALIAGFLGMLVVLAGIGAVLFAVAGLTAPTIAYMGLGAIVLVAACLTVIAIANTFFWNYWTLAYVRLSGRAAAAA